MIWKYIGSAGLLLALSTANAQDYEIDERQVRADIEFLASDALEGRATGMQGELVAAEYLAARFKALGLTPTGDEATYFQEFSVKSDNIHSMEVVDSGSNAIRVLNVIASIDKAAPFTVVIGAHYDHLGYGHFFGSLYDGPPAIHNGADDNASGVAAMLALAEYFAVSNVYMNFVFIGFSGEERGLWGSNYFTKNPTIDLGNVSYMLNFDMVGRLNAQSVLSINGIGTAAEWSEAISRTKSGNMQTVTTESGMGASDHTSFYLQDVPAVHFFTGPHKDYHKPSDDAHLVNYAGVVKVVEFVIELIDNLPSDRRLTFQQTKDDNQPSARDFKVTLGVMPDYLYNERGMRIDGIRPDRPAANAGILKGDIVIKIGDLEIEDMQGYMEALGAFEEGQTVEITVLRDGQTLVKEATF